MRTILQDIHFALRLLLKRASALTLEVVLTLVLVAGAFLLIETMIHSAGSNDFKRNHAPLTALPSLNL